jgi:hypothetical protein
VQPPGHDDRFTRSVTRANTAIALIAALDGDVRAELLAYETEQDALQGVLSTSHAARCTARHGVGSQAVPSTIECAIPTGKGARPPIAPPYGHLRCPAPIASSGEPT